MKYLSNLESKGKASDSKCLESKHCDQLFLGGFFRPTSFQNTFGWLRLIFSEGTFQRCSLGKVFWKCAANLQVCRSVISIKLQSNFIEITRRSWCSPLNLLHNFRTRFCKKNLWRELLQIFDKANRFRYVFTTMSNIYDEICKKIFFS